MSIELTDEIREHRFTSPLKSENMKYYTEHFALSVLRYFFDEYDDWIVCDAPDLQSADGTAGIEVTELTISLNKAIVGDCLNYWKTGDVKYSEKAEHRGAAAGDMYYILPIFDSDDELSALEAIFRKKLRKLKSYKKRGFKSLGLILVMDALPIRSTEVNWADVVRVLQSDSPEKYDVIYLVYPTVLGRYDRSDGAVEYRNISREDYPALEKYARIMAEKSIGK